MFWMISKNKGLLDDFWDWDSQYMAIAKILELKVKNPADNFYLMETVSEAKIKIIDEKKIVFLEAIEDEK